MPRKRQPVQKPLKKYEGNEPGKTVKAPVMIGKAPYVQETGDGERDGKIWLARISKTQQLRLAMRNGLNDWKRYYMWFEGEQWMERGLEASQLASDNARNTATVNITGSIALSYMPFLINGQIKFRVKAREEKDIESATVQQGLLNYEWTERGMTEECKAIVQDVVVIGHGIGKTGYTVEVDEARRKGDGEIEYRDYIRKDAAYIERVDPRFFLKDLSARDGTLKTARWVAECCFATYDDVLANSTYKRSSLDMINTGIYTLAQRAGYEGVGLGTPPWGTKLDQSTPEDHLVALWEIWDKKYRKRYVYAEGLPHPLVEEDWPYDYLDGFPYTQIDFIRIPNAHYGMGIMRLAEDQQLQKNRIRTAQFLHVRSHARKFLAITGALGVGELEKFTDGPDGTVIQAERPDAIQPIPDAQMSADFQIIEARIDSDILQLTGGDALLTGGPLPSRTTGVEVTTRTNVMRLKADDRVSAVEVGVNELARQVLHHLKANRTLDDVVRIVGPDGADAWQSYSPDEIRADTDVIVEYFSAPKYDPALDRQQKLQAVDLLIKAMPVLAQVGAAKQIDFSRALGSLLKSFDDVEITTFFKDSRFNEAMGEINQGGGMTPEVGGGFAPGPVGQSPNGAPPIPPELMNILMQTQGAAVGGSGGLPQV